jgi:hypothetical protein
VKRTIERAMRGLDGQDAGADWRGKDGKLRRVVPFAVEPPSPRGDPAAPRRAPGLAKGDGAARCGSAFARAEFNVSS